MKKIVYSEKEKKFVELEYKQEFDKQGRLLKIYNEKIIGYDNLGNPIYLETDEELFLKDLKKIESTESLVSQRMSTCKSCDNFLSWFKICKECKCVLPIKARFKNQKCPINKW
jgi:hypothetical protein